MQPYYDDGTVTIYHGDCREIAPLLDADVIVSDPPYGMGWNTDTSRFSGGHRGHRASVARCGQGRADWGSVRADDEPFDPAPWLGYEHVVLWGSNHFASRLPVGTTLVWIKRFESAYGSFLSDAEVAWAKGGHGVYCRRDTSLMADARDRLHPTQKPLGVMRWSIECAGGTGVILDPFMGSGSTLRAAKDLGRRAVGIETEERYCELAAARMGQEVLDLAA
jgi:site-specific DNA-methyltransferase (adenine-specific)